LEKARISAAEAARSGPGRIHTRPAGKKPQACPRWRERGLVDYELAVGPETLAVGLGFRALDTESLDVSCQLGAVFQPKPGGDQSNVVRGRSLAAVAVNRPRLAA